MPTRDALIHQLPHPPPPVRILRVPYRHMPHVVFAFVLGYICLSHIYRAYVDYMGWSLDFTGPQV